MGDVFRKLSARISLWVGTPIAFLLALIAIIVWLVTGPMFNYSDTWQLVINTATTIITFLMVFLIQNTQNRDSRALHLKLDELLKGVKGARTGLVSLEELSDAELDALEEEFQALHLKYAKALKQRKERKKNNCPIEREKYVQTSF